VKNTYYRDADGDSYGNPNDSVQACSVSQGYIDNHTDCDDDNIVINPDTVWYKDIDGDHCSDGNTLTQCIRPADYYLATELIAVSGDCGMIMQILILRQPRFVTG